jgi:hypothetical protein
MFLSRDAVKIYSIEPERTLFQNAKIRFEKNLAVEIVEGLSEDVLGPVLEKVAGDVNFWLDGHFSAGPTFQGPKDTPVLEELKTIGSHLNRLGKVSILIDDVRCFSSSDPQYESYPSLDELVTWAKANGFSWNIQYDILVLRNYQ